MPATNFPAFLEAEDGPDRNVYRLISRVKIMEVPRSYLISARLAALDNRIDDCELEAKAPVRISIDKYAVTPQRTATATTNSVTLLALALAFGFGSVLAIVLAFDLLDNRIRTPRGFELALGAPGPDLIASYVSSVASDADFAGATLAAQGHGSVHATRELAVRLNFECERGGGACSGFRRVTHWKPRCGKTAGLGLN